MTITFRTYRHPADWQSVGDLLMAHYQPGNRDGNWFQPTWEYMFSHPMLDESALDRIGLWEEDGALVAAVHYESTLGEVFLEVDPRYHHLKPEMLTYAEQALYGTDETGKRFVRPFVNDFDHALEALVQTCGYVPDGDNKRPMSQFVIPSPFPAISVPAGFRLMSLAEDNDLVKLDRTLWRGFNHPGEPDGDLEGRRKMESVPNYRHDLKIVVQAPNGAFVAFCGMWYEPRNRFGYVEPVATDPDYRRLGLGKAAVWEGIRRCGELGATVAYVGATLPFYLSIGFQKLYDSRCWYKEL
jgi:GNAT superfamily N-acetyltransferase